MFHTKQLNNRKDSLHEKTLRVTYQVGNSSFNELLKSVSTHYKNANGNISSKNGPFSSYYE